jgi:hypothetical protein
MGHGGLVLRPDEVCSNANGVSPRVFGSKNLARVEAILNPVADHASAFTPEVGPFCDLGCAAG